MLIHSLKRRPGPRVRVGGGPVRTGRRRRPGKRLLGERQWAGARLHRTSPLSWVGALPRKRLRKRPDKNRRVK